MTAAACASVPPHLIARKPYRGVIYAFASLRSCRASLRLWTCGGRLSPVNLCLYRQYSRRQHFYLQNEYHHRSSYCNRRIAIPK